MLKALIDRKFNRIKKINLFRQIKVKKIKKLKELDQIIVYLILRHFKNNNRFRKVCCHQFKVKFKYNSHNRIRCVRKKLKNFDFKIS
jgi:hypothetical protein